MSKLQSVLQQNLGKPVANASFAMLRGYIRSAQRRGVAMMHTARPFSYYRKIFFKGQPRKAVLDSLQGKRLVDVGCGYTPYAADSMFRACHDAGIDFYGVDPLIRSDISFGFKARALARATGGSGNFSTRAPGLDKALCASAENLPFDDNSIDEILCSYLLFVWIDDEPALAAILEEFSRVLQPGGVVKIYPLYEWRLFRFNNPRLRSALDDFTVSQTFVHGGRDWRVQPSMLTLLTRRGAAVGADLIPESYDTRG